MDRACNTQGGNKETTENFGYKTLMEKISYDIQIEK